MPYISASIIFQLLGERLSAARAVAEGGRSGPQENQRIHAVCHRVFLFVPKLVLPAVVHHSAGLRAAHVSRTPDGGMLVQLADHLRADDDRRHRVPDVARRADRRVRHRQRHQPVDHGGHSGRTCRAPAGNCCRRPSLELGGGGSKLGIEGLVLLAVHVRRRGDGRGVHHARPAADSRCRAPSTSAAAASTAAPGSTCRSRSIRPASCRSSSPAAC